MSLYDVIKEEEEALKAVENPAVKEEPAEEVVEETVTGEQEKKLEPAKAEEPAKQDSAPVIDNATIARLRFEASEERRRREELEARLARLESPPKPADVDAEPNKAEEPEQWLEWKNRQLEKETHSIKSEVEEFKKWKQQQEEAAIQQQTFSQAIKEFSDYENAFRSKAPDYEQASEFYRNKLSDSIKTLNPMLTDAQVTAQVNMQILRQAAFYEQQGFNPVERMYNDVKRMGFVPKASEEKPAKASLDTIEKNKKKSATPLAAGGKGGDNALTLDAIASMSNAEFSRLTPAQLRALEGME